MKKIGITILAICILAIGYFVWETAEIRQFAGEYRSVDATDSAYELTLSKTGRLKVVDIGAGNPTVEGCIFKIPFQDEYYLKTGGETDDVFLNLGDNKGEAAVWLSVIGRVDGEAPETFRIITIDTGSAHMQFNENSYFE